MIVRRRPSKSSKDSFFLNFESVINHRQIHRGALDAMECQRGVDLATMMRRVVEDVEQTGTMTSGSNWYLTVHFIMHITTPWRLDITTPWRLDTVQVRLFIRQRFPTTLVVRAVCGL